MISRPLLACLCAGLLLSGCATFTEQELGIIQRNGVSPRTVAKFENGRSITPEEVIELSRQRVPDPYVLRQIDDVGVDYVLTPEDFKKLQQARVSPPIIDALVAASDEFSARYASPGYDVYAGDPYFYDRYPDYDGYYGPRRSRIHGSVGIGISTHQIRPGRRFR